MNYIEDISWILDKPGTTVHNQEEKFAANIAFVHSLGKKCDRVGWSQLSRDDPKADEILKKIAAFCKENGWSARGSYTRAYANLHTDWFEIDGAYFGDRTFGEHVSVPAQNGGTVTICRIRAYREPTVAPKRWGKRLYVPQRFFGAYCKNAMTGLDFCWAKDMGKYDAQQYFEIFGTVRIPQVATAWDLDKQDLRKLGSDGGWLPRLGEVFSEWTQLNLPYCYRKEDMPDGGIAYAYIPSTFSCCGLYQVLVHKDVAQQLLKENAIPAGSLKPVPVLDVIPSGYTLRETSICPRPTKAFMEQSLLDCEALNKKERPQWQIPEKEAIKALRKVKADRKEDFGKKLSQAKAEALAATEHSAMLPYYSVADGGCLSDEYRFLSVEESVSETKAFCKTMVREELLEAKPDGIVICVCANGDRILRRQDGTVIRFSHEVPETIQLWPSLAQFIVDAIHA